MLRNNLGQVQVHTHVPLSPSSITWYRPKGSDALRLGRKLQAWRKVMAAYRRVDDLRSPAGWLPVYRDQLRAQRSVSSMGKSLPLPFSDTVVVASKNILLILHFYKPEPYRFTSEWSADNDVNGIISTGQVGESGLFWIMATLQNPVQSLHHQSFVAHLVLLSSLAYLGFLYFYFSLI